MRAVYGRILCSSECGRRCLLTCSRRAPPCSTGPTRQSEHASATAARHRDSPQRLRYNDTELLSEPACGCGGPSTSSRHKPGFADLLCRPAGRVARRISAACKSRRICHPSSSPLPGCSQLRRDRTWCYWRITCCGDVDVAHTGIAESDLCVTAS